MKSGLGHCLSKGSYPFSRELGWSHSRYEKFATCRRQYWYSYYGKHDRPQRSESP